MLFRSVVALAATIYFDIDALKGVMIAVAFTFIYYLIIKLGTFNQLSETVFSGFNSMVYALAILMMSYVLKDVNDKMGLTQYVLNAVSPKANFALTLWNDTLELHQSARTINPVPIVD